MTHGGGSSAARFGGESLVGRFTRAGDLELEGSANALRTLAHGLRAAPSSIRLGKPASEDPSPYDGFLEIIEVERADSKVTVSKRENALVVRGNEASLELLAVNLETLSEDSAAGEHLHIDYHPDHFFLEPTSSPLVVELTRSVS